MSKSWCTYRSLESVSFHFGCILPALFQQSCSSQADVTALRCPVPDCREGFDGDVLRQLLGVCLRTTMLGLLGNRMS